MWQTSATVVTPTSKRWIWLLVPLLALCEVGAHGLIRARVPGDDAWRRAAALVRAELRSGDAVTVAPTWADPILRRHLGDLIPLAMAGRSDLAAYRRLWALSIRGHRPDVPGAAGPTLQREFGPVTVLRYDLPTPTVRHDLVEHLFDARVEQGKRAEPCPLRTLAPPRGGGLGKGVIPPGKRFVCNAKSARGFVAPVVLEDLALAPRYCTFHPALKRGPVRVTFANVPLADELVFHAGLYYEDERHGKGAPVHMRVLIDGAERGSLTHRDGDGWVRFTVPTPAHAPATVTIEVDSSRPHKRGFCWAGSVRTGGP